MGLWRILKRDFTEFYDMNIKGLFLKKKGLPLWDSSLDFYWPKPKKKKVKSWWDNYNENNLS